MAQLKWDNVTAPSGSSASGSTSGIETAAKLLSGGFGGMANALGQFSDRQALEQLSRYTDAQQLQRDLQSGAFNTGNASAEALTKIMGRPAALITDAHNQQVVDHNAVMNPLNQQYRQLEIANKTITDPLNQETLRQSIAHNAVMNPLIEAEKTLGNNKASLEFTRGEEVRNLGLHLGQRWADYKQNNLMTPQATYAFLEQYKDNPVAYQLASGLVAKEVPGFNQAIISPSLDSIPGAGGTVPVAGQSATTSAEGTAGTYKGSPYDVVYGYGKYGVPPKPLTDSSLKEVVEFGKNVLIPNTKGTLPNQPKDVGTSASGRYQFTQETLSTYGPKVFGADWENVKFSPENQDKLGEALFNDRKNGNLKAVWEGAPNATPGAYKDLSWDQFKSQVIDRFESPTASSGQQPTALTPGQQVTAISNKVTQDNTTSRQLLQAANMFSDTGLMNAAAAAYEKDPKGLETPQAVASKLTGKDGALNGIDINDTRSAVEQVQTELGVSASVAGTIVERAIKDGFFSTVGGFGVFDKQKIDFDKLGNLLDTIGGKRDKNGKYENRNKVSSALDALVKGTATENAKSKLDTSEKEIAEITARIKTFEGVGTPAAQAALAVENAKLALARGKQEQALSGTSSAVLGLVGDLTPPPPVGTVSPVGIHPTSEAKPVNQGNPNFYSAENIAARAKAQAERRKQIAAEEAAEKAKAEALKIQEEQERARKFRESYEKSGLGRQQQSQQVR